MRSRVYELFTAQLTRHEAQKASVGGAISVEEIEREPKAYSERLATETEENVAETSAARSGALFREARAGNEVLRAPFGIESLLLAATKTGPPREIGGDVGFLHEVRFLLIRHRDGASVHRPRDDLDGCASL